MTLKGIVKVAVVRFIDPLIGVSEICTPNRYKSHY